MRYRQHVLALSALMKLQIKHTFAMDAVLKRAYKWSETLTDLHDADVCDDHILHLKIIFTKYCQMVKVYYMSI